MIFRTKHTVPRKRRKYFYTLPALPNDQLTFGCARGGQDETAFTVQQADQLIASCRNMLQTQLQSQSSSPLSCRCFLWSIGKATDVVTLPTFNMKHRSRKHVSSSVHVLPPITNTKRQEYSTFSLADNFDGNAQNAKKIP